MTQDIEKPRIANATTDTHKHEEIEITMEMISAGVSALEERLGVLPYSMIVESVYIAMTQQASLLEISDAMLEAGAEMFFNYDGLQFGTAETAAYAIFTAMASQSPRLRNLLEAQD